MSPTLHLKAKTREDARFRRCPRKKRREQASSAFHQGFLVRVALRRAIARWTKLSSCSHANAQAAHDEDRTEDIDQQRKTKKDDQLQGWINSRQEIVI